MPAPARAIEQAGGVFVTGTGTEVGKTVVSAALVRALDGDFWKPVQTGCLEDSDSDTVARLAALGPDQIHPPAHVYEAPLSPHEAARLEGAAISLEDFALPETERPLVVEGAGGVLVPLNGRHTMADLMSWLGLPCVLVALSGLGTINHTLLSLEALKARHVPVLGVVMNGEPNAANADAVRAFGGVSVLMEIPPLEPLDESTVAAMARGLATALQGDAP
jgi:dethiobiotin synthase